MHIRLKESRGDSEIDQKAAEQIRHRRHETSDESYQGAKLRVTSARGLRFAASARTAPTTGCSGNLPNRYCHSQTIAAPTLAQYGQRLYQPGFTFRAGLTSNF